MDMINTLIPTEEPERQRYFLEKAASYVAEEAGELGRPLTFCVNTFGCQMNARDSEKLRGILECIGYVEAPDEQADFVIYNTCTVRENANMDDWESFIIIKRRIPICALPCAAA